MVGEQQPLVAYRTCEHAAPDLHADVERSRRQTVAAFVQTRSANCDEGVRSSRRFERTTATTNEMTQFLRRQTALINDATGSEGRSHGAAANFGAIAGDFLSSSNRVKWRRPNQGERLT